MLNLGGADVAVVVVGLSEAAQSEGFDRRHLDLPEGHVASSGPSSAWRGGRWWR